MAAEYAAPWLGMARAGITGGSEADAMDWARETLGPVANIDISPEAREVQAEIANTLGTGARALYENTPISTIAESGYGRGVAQKAGEAWSNLSDDTKAKLEMSLAALDINPGVGLAGFVPGMIKKASKAEFLPGGKGHTLAPAGKPNQYNMPGREGIVRPVNVDPKNPLVADVDVGPNKKPEKWALEMEQAFEEGRIDEAALLAEGHDAVIIKRPGGKSGYRLTSPEQITNRRYEEALKDAYFQRESQDAIDAGLASSIDVGARRAFERPKVAPSKKQNPNWHPASNTRMQTPYEDLTATLVDTPGAKSEALELTDPRDEVGTWAVGSAWDRTGRGKTVTHVNDKELSRPVPLEGGFGYISDPTTGAGASGKSVVSSIMNAGKRTGEDVVDVIPFTLGHQGSNFSTMVTDVHLGRKKDFPVSKDAVKAFDEEMRSTKVGDDWPGYDSPDLQEFMDNNPDARTTFLKKQQLARYKKEGFPDVESSIKAVTAEDMRDMPDMYGGRAIGRMDLTKEAGPVPGGHKSYDWDIPAAGRGKTYGKDYPARTRFMDWGAQRELMGAKVGDDQRSFQMSYPVQEMTPELAEILAIHPGYRGGQ